MEQKKGKIAMVACINNKQKGTIVNRRQYLLLRSRKWLLLVKD